MIAVRFRNLTCAGAVKGDGASGSVGFSVEGHAGFAFRGNDVVCAAVSVLAQTAVMAITKIAGIRQDIEQFEGYLRTRCSMVDASPGAIRDLQVILHTMMIGLDEIRKVHPERIKIDYE